MRFYAEKDMALCGLACVLCSEENCPGCKARGCKEVGDCSVYQCAAKKGLEGCYECDAFPCEEKMLKGIRNRAFNRYARQWGKQALLTRLRANFENGITYHKPGGLQGDYDLLAAEEEIIRLIHFGSHDPYEKCPVLEAEHFALGLVRMEDAEDLLACYSALRTREIFTADKYIRDFRYQTLGDMQACIRFWLEEYENRVYIRFSIFEREAGRAIGTVEMFPAKERLAGCDNLGILRLDLAPHYEKKPFLQELLTLCIPSFHELFDVAHIVLLTPPVGKERICVLGNMGFAPFTWPDGERKHYRVHHRNKPPQKR